MQETINKIKMANYAYRTGNSIISDEVYDKLLDDLSKQMPYFDSFRQALTESKGDVKLPYIVGSLNKIKSVDLKTLDKFVKKIKSIVYSVKLDGMAFTAYYRNGIFFSGATRGDGYYGKDITNKLLHILPNKLENPIDIDIRGELVFTGESHSELGFTTRRAGIVGLMGRDNAQVNDLKKIRPVVYQILSSDKTILKQYSLLQELGFMVPEYGKTEPVDNLSDFLSEELVRFKESSDYDMDGLVIFGENTVNEQEFYPKNMAAFKLDAEPVFTTVKEIEWSVSKGGLMKPVVVVETVSIDNTNVSRATGFNATYIRQNGIGVGAKIGIIKSGDIIPKIVEIQQTTEVNLPTTCPSCNSALVEKGVELACSNSSCDAMELMKTASFLEKMGIEGVSEVSLRNWNIRNMEQLLTFQSDGSANQDKFSGELKNKVFGNKKENIFASMYFDGMGRKTVGKMIKHYDGLDNATSIFFGFNNLPFGIGEKTIEKAKEDWMINLELLNKITSSQDYNPISAESKELEGKTFLFTGTLTVPRREVEALVRSKGGEIASSVSKNLHYLVVGTDAGSKLVKAQKLGTKILSEEEFKNIIGG